MCKISIQLSQGKCLTHPDDILAVIRKQLPRSETKFRGREDFEVVFRVMDLLNKKPPPRLAEIASELRLGSRNLEQNVQAKREIFAHLADMFNIRL